MSISDRLRTDIERAHQHLTRCRNELTRFLAYTVMGTQEAHDRTKRKLQEDITRAEKDLAHARHAFDRHLEELGMS